MNSSAIKNIIDTLSYANQFKGHTFLIKLGGSILIHDDLIESLCQDLKLLVQTGIKLVLVHGGGPAINQACQLHQIKTQFIKGVRVTCDSSMKIIEMVLCGHVNPLLVRKLNHLGISAVGLSGASDGMLKCTVKDALYGKVGEIKAVNTHPISHILSSHQTFPAIPVIAPVGMDENGLALNVNADDAACHIATALKVDKLILLTDQEGIYDSKRQTISRIFIDDIQRLMDEKIVSQGMLVKVKMIRHALESGLNNIHILNGHHKHVLLEELFTKNGCGTLCQKSAIPNHPHEAIL
jgi:acetylglutamate kinase